MSATASRTLGQVEAEFFRLLNALIEPAVLMGCGAPGVVPTGLIVLETTGAKSGNPRRAPLVATVIDGCVFVSTIRGRRSGWMWNLRAHPEVRYWLGGRERRGRARVFAPGEPAPPTRGLPAIAGLIAERLLPPAALFGWTFAVIHDD